MTELYPVGSTDLEPETFFFWDSSQQATIEITRVSEGSYLIRGAKSYRLLRQDEEAQRNWDRNLRNLHDYLADTFHSFQLAVDYSNEVSKDSLRDHAEAEQLAQESVQLREEKEGLEQKLENLQQNRRHGFDELEPVLEQKISSLSEDLSSVDAQLEEAVTRLKKQKEKIGQWEQNGVMMSYLFTFFTEPEVVSSHQLPEAVDRHLSEVYKHHQHSVKQTLTRRSGKFKLTIQDLEHPRVFSRLQHTALLNPASFEELVDANPGLEDHLEELKHAQLQQYEAYALRDLQTADGVFESSKATPAQAVQSILKQLETHHDVSAVDAPNDGPMIGTVAGTNQVVGFDPSELPHLYIVGESGSGKSHLKRVFIENVASLNYHVLTINPGDTQNIGLNLPGEENGESTGIPFDQYWIGSDRFLDKPDNLQSLFTGLNAVTLEEMPSDEKQEFIDDVFTELAEIDSTSQPLFVFLDEAHNFNQGDAANSIQKIARESRKFGVNLVLVSQSPTDYSYNQRHVRENTMKIFFAGEFFNYADNFLDSGDEISELDTGQAIIPEGRDLPRMTVDVRDVVTRFWEHTPSESEIQEVASMFEAQPPELDFDDSDNHATETKESSPTTPPSDLEEEEEEVVEAIREYIQDHDQRPSKNKTVEYSPFGTSKTSRILSQLEEKEVVRTDTETRYGNEATVYSPADQ